MGNNQEIAHGTATTDSEGRFDLQFFARPDPSVSEKDEPRFQFTIHADVTDITGETRTDQRVVNVGFTALSVVVAPQVEGQGRWSEIDASLYAPIAQGVVVMQHPEGIQNQAMQFRDFLFSDRAREMLINFGYSVDE